MESFAYTVEAFAWTGESSARTGESLARTVESSAHTGEGFDLIEESFATLAVTNAVNYSVQTAPAAPRVIIGGLKPGETLWARACANGSAGASEWTAPTTAMAI